MRRNEHFHPVTPSLYLPPRVLCLFIILYTLPKREVSARSPCVPLEPPKTQEHLGL